MKTTFSPERLFKIRRLRKARRCWKYQPLFAYLEMTQHYNEYTLSDFVDDLRRRTKPKQKRKKSTLPRYGRYPRMQKMLSLFQQTGDAQFGLQAICLRNQITKPYRLLVKLHKMETEYFFSAKIPYESINQLCSSLRDCTTQQEVDEKVTTFNKGFIYGY